MHYEITSRLDTAAKKIRELERHENRNYPKWNRETRKMKDKDISNYGRTLGKGLKAVHKGNQIGGRKKIFWKAVSKIFLNLMKTINSQTQEAQ